MKKALFATVLMGLLVCPVAFAQEQAREPAPIVFDTGEEMIDLIEDIGDWIFTIVLVVAAIFLIVSGFLFVTAGGDPAKVQMAKQMLINALIGVAVALLAKGLVAVIRSILAGY